MALCALLSSTVHGGEMRDFRNTAGKTLKASFEGVSGDKIKLRREDGKTFELSKVRQNHPIPKTGG